MKEIYIGTSGYNYPHWRNNVFYSGCLPQNKWLEFYCTKFNSVELNVTFYRLPSKKAFEGWNKRTPKDFKFVVKGNRFITHIKRLKDVKEPIKNFAENLAPLNKKTSCILWQFPPNFKSDAERLKVFIRDLEKLKLTKLFRHAFEFRNESWFTENIYSILRNNNSCLCIADLPCTTPNYKSSGQARVQGRPNSPHVEERTADFIYIRFHGSRARYSSNYSQTELKKVAEKAKEWLKSCKAIYAFFNNDAYGYAPKNAATFRYFLTGFTGLYG